jgi:hypothetical protein
MSGIHPVPNPDDPGSPPTLPTLEETDCGNNAVSPAPSRPESVSGQMMEYVSHAIFIVVALMVMDWLHHSKPPSVEVGHHFHSIRGDGPFPDIRIIEKLKKTFL